MKKMALLTFHDTTNFGALLQTYALYRFLNDCGIDCHILDYQCENIIRREIPQKPNFSLAPKQIAKNILIYPKLVRRHNAMLRFSKKYMPKITKRYDRSSVFEISEVFDAFLVGSDMLWGLNITGDDYSYFLDFIPKEIPKYSYATSIGKDWSDEEQEKVSRLLQRFTSLSVREDATAEKLQKMLNLPCDVVCDPTMLITPQEWRALVSNKYKNKNYVLVYFDSDDGKCLRDAQDYASSRGLKLLMVSTRPSFSHNLISVFPYEVADFLSLIYHAEAVFTASYHGLLFSIYFHRYFIYYNRRPAYRMQTVARRLGIEEREGHGEISKEMAQPDYGQIDANVDAFRQHSFRWINATLR